MIAPRPGCEILTCPVCWRKWERAIGDFTRKCPRGCFGKNPRPDPAQDQGATHVWVDAGRQMLDDAPVPTDNRMSWPDSFSSGGGGDFGGGGSSGDF